MRTHWEPCADRRPAPSSVGSTYALDASHTASVPSGSRRSPHAGQRTAPATRRHGPGPATHDPSGARRGYDSGQWMLLGALVRRRGSPVQGQTGGCFGSTAFITTTTTTPRQLPLPTPMHRHTHVQAHIHRHVQAHTRTGTHTYRRIHRQQAHTRTDTHTYNLGRLVR